MSKPIRPHVLPLRSLVLIGVLLAGWLCWRYVPHTYAAQSTAAEQSAEQPAVPLRNLSPANQRQQLTTRQQKPQPSPETSLASEPPPEFAAAITPTVSGITQLALAANDHKQRYGRRAEPGLHVTVLRANALSRFPEPRTWADGFPGRLNVLNNCADVNNSPGCDRLTVSQSFFQSQDFQLKGLFVYLYYRVSFARLPTYAELIPDIRAVTGRTSDEVYARRTAFADSWLLRPAFRSASENLSNVDYVNTLLGRYNLGGSTTPDPLNPDGAPFVTLTRSGLIGGLNAGTLTRAQALRAIVESREVQTAEFDSAFVAMQYYGYLRRTPEPSGYQNWLTYLKAHPTDTRTMVNGFLNSIEYRLRFGPVTPWPQANCARLKGSMLAPGC